jgi:hypothetical protein
LEEAACSALSKGLNYAVTPRLSPIKDVLYGVEKQKGPYPKILRGKRQETVRILKGSRQPKDNLTASELLTLLPADKGNAAVVLGTSDYNQKIATLLEEKAYKKPTHISFYFSAKFHHHPSNKQALLSTLLHRIRVLYDEDSLQADLLILMDVFIQNGYNYRQIHRALNRRSHLDQPDNKPSSVAFLPFV